MIKTCGENYVTRDEVQTLLSPNWPDNYPNNLDCQWIISSNQGRKFVVILEQGKTESEFDFVEVSIATITTNNLNTRYVKNNYGEFTFVFVQLKLQIVSSCTLRLTLLSYYTAHPASEL